MVKKTRFVPLALSMRGKQETLIDLQWSSPALVFWHRYTTSINAYALVVIQSGVTETVIQQNTGVTLSGCYQQLDLKAFAGKPIKIIFRGKDAVGADNLSSSLDWTVQDVRIIPAFSPDLMPGTEWCQSAP